MKNIIVTSTALVFCGLLIGMSLFLLRNPSCAGVNSLKTELAVTIPASNLFFAPSEWKVHIRPTPKPNAYDIIVVGSGIGGLMAAALLANRGCRVLVLERADQVGGYCVSYQRNGFWFTAGVENISGLWQGTPLRRQLDELFAIVGVKFDDLFERNRPLYLKGGKSIDLSDSAKRVENVVVAAWPGKTEVIKRFFAESRAVYEGIYRGSNAYGIWAQPATYQNMLDHYFFDNDTDTQEIQAFLTALVGQVGTSARDITAQSALHGCVGYLLKGGHYIKGTFNGKRGAGALAEVLAEVVKQKGGTVLTQAEVVQVDIGTTTVFGGAFTVHVKESGTVYESPIVLLNANAKTGLRLFPQLTAVADEVARLKLSQSGVLVHIGITRDVFAKNLLPTIIHRGGGSISLQILAPNKTSVSIILATPDDLPISSSSQYAQYETTVLREWREKLPMILHDELGLTIKPKELVVGDVATKYTFEQYTLMPEGAFFAFDNANKKKLQFKTPVPGLYLASASAGGGGIEAVMMVGLKCARDIEVSVPGRAVR